MDPTQPHDTDDQRWKEFTSLSEDQRIELAMALLRRDQYARRDAGFELLKKEYPTAAESILRSAAFHAYWEGPRDFCSLMAWSELNLRRGEHDWPHGLGWNALYALYNVLQVEALVPYGARDVLEDLAEIKECLENDDKAGAAGTLEHLIKTFEASKSPPLIE
jgi:hypothetical protein